MTKVVTLIPGDFVSPYLIKDTLKAFGDFKNKQKSVWGEAIDMLKYTYAQRLISTLSIEIKHKC